MKPNIRNVHVKQGDRLKLSKSVPPIAVVALTDSRTDGACFSRKAIMKTRKPLKRKTPLRAKKPWRWQPKKYTTWGMAVYERLARKRSGFRRRKRQATEAERVHLSRVKGLPCVVCLAPPPSHVHHIREGKGMGQRASHYETIPLCKKHHQGAGAGEISIHNRRQTFIERFGTEAELLVKTRAFLGIIKFGV